MRQPRESPPSRKKPGVRGSQSGWQYTTSDRQEAIYGGNVSTSAIVAGNSARELRCVPGAWKTHNSCSFVSTPRYFTPEIDCSRFCIIDCDPSKLEQIKVLRARPAALLPCCPLFHFPIAPRTLISSSPHRLFPLPPLSSAIVCTHLGARPFSLTHDAKCRNLTPSHRPSHPLQPWT